MPIGSSSSFCRFTARLITVADVHVLPYVIKQVIQVCLGTVISARQRRPRANTTAPRKQ